MPNNIDQVLIKLENLKTENLRVFKFSSFCCRCMFVGVRCSTDTTQLGWQVGNAWNGNQWLLARMVGVGTSIAFACWSHHEDCWCDSWVRKLSCIPVPVHLENTGRASHVSRLCCPLLITFRLLTGVCISSCWLLHLFGPQAKEKLNGDRVNPARCTLVLFLFLVFFFVLHFNFPPACQRDPQNPVVRVLVGERWREWKECAESPALLSSRWRSWLCSCWPRLWMADENGQCRQDMLRLPSRTRRNPWKSLSSMRPNALQRTVSTSNKDRWKPKWRPMEMSSKVELQQQLQNRCVAENAQEHGIVFLTIVFSFSGVVLGKLMRKVVLLVCA